MMVPDRSAGQPPGLHSGLMIFMNRLLPVRLPSPADRIGAVTATHTSTPLRTLYPLASTSSEWLAVPGGHEIHVQHSGASQGLPVVVLHGGPGSGLSPLLRRFLDPQRFRIVGIDQRGAGLSRPRGSVENNTLADLLADMRRVRAHLGIERWLVVGGSWGATLAVAHALDAPDSVAGLLLRGLFLARPRDVEAFFDGVAHGQPQAWRTWKATAHARAESLPGALFDALSSVDDDRANAAALQWWRWETALAGQAPAPAPDPDAHALQGLVARYLIQSHYLRHGCWLGDAPLLERAASLPNVPTLLLHGRLDRICPPAGAEAFHAKVPHCRLRWVDGAGHDPTHPAMVDAMVTALDTWAETGDFGIGPSS